MAETKVPYIVFCSVSVAVIVWALWRAHRKGVTVGKMISAILEDMFSL